MHIYIDESGQFIRATGSTPSISGVGGVVFPDSQRRSILRAYKKIKNKWSPSSGEFKGSALDESQVSEVLNMLSSFDVLFFPVMIDLTNRDDTRVTKAKNEQAATVVENITDGYHADIVKELRSLKDSINALPNQLYAQLVCQVHLFEMICRTTILYYSQEHPLSLSNFHWVIDAKNKEKITKYEDAFQKILLPMLQHKMLSNPIITLEEGNYDYFRLSHDYSQNFPQFLRGFYPEKPIDKPYIDANRILMERFFIVPSDDNLGIQIADILISTLRRALRGNIQDSGWEGLKKILMKTIESKEHIYAIKLCSLGGSPSCTVAYENVLDRLERGARSPIK